MRRDIKVVKRKLKLQLRITEFLGNRIRELQAEVDDKKSSAYSDGDINEETNQIIDDMDANEIDALRHQRQDEPRCQLRRERRSRPVESMDAAQQRYVLNVLRGLQHEQEKVSDLKAMVAKRDEVIMKLNADIAESNQRVEELNEAIRNLTVELAAFTQTTV